ncbi:MAG: hypothetical protein UZ16_OP3001001895 [Candidatus Hinthialibacteria bacterium OLB16]|nr:MAG: hypothetical protein UZ16_OP3001001895 [Candidatus Hinthialibacteria bacterium OLB16]
MSRKMQGVELSLPVELSFPVLVGFPSGHLHLPSSVIPVLSLSSRGSGDDRLGVGNDGLEVGNDELGGQGKQRGKGNDGSRTGGLIPSLSKLN